MGEYSLSRRAFGLRMVELSAMGSALSSPRLAWADQPHAPPDPVVVVPSEMRPKPGFILVSDQQLLDLQNPDKPVDISLSNAPRSSRSGRCARRRRQGGDRRW